MMVVQSSVYIFWCESHECNNFLYRISDVLEHSMVVPCDSNVTILSILRKTKTFIPILFLFDYLFQFSIVRFFFYTHSKFEIQGEWILSGSEGCNSSEFHELHMYAVNCVNVGTSKDPFLTQVSCFAILFGNELDAEVYLSKNLVYVRNVRNCLLMVCWSCRFYR